MFNLNQKAITVKSIVVPKTLVSFVEGDESGELAFYSGVLMYWDSNISKWLSVEEYTLPFSSDSISQGRMNFDGNLTDIVFGATIGSSTDNIKLVSVELNRNNTVPSSDINFSVLRNNVQLFPLDFTTFDIVRHLPIDLENEDSETTGNASFSVLQDSLTIQGKVLLNLNYRIILK